MAPNDGETAPAAATPDMFLDASGAAVREASLNGYRAVGVPGTVMGVPENGVPNAWSEKAAPRTSAKAAARIPTATDLQPAVIKVIQISLATR